MAENPPNPAAPTPAAKAVAAERLERSIYLAMRMKALQAEIKALRIEGREVQTSLRGLLDRQTPEAKALKWRRIYTAKRPEEAKAELEAVIAARKALMGKTAA